MSSISTFDSPDEPLLDLLRDIGDARIQLPEFQRDWVWDDEHVRGILASVSLSYPIGAVMMLSTGSRGASLKARLVQGVAATGAAPDRLILDGQQRLTALYQALLSGRPVKTQDARKNDIHRYYFIDIHKALDPAADREEDAIVALPPGLQTKNFRGEVGHD